MSLFTEVVSVLLPPLPKNPYRGFSRSKAPIKIESWDLPPCSNVNGYQVKQRRQKMRRKGVK